MNFSGGIGTADDPWLIADAVQLNSVRNDPGACYRLLNDVALTGFWTPIPLFTGVLDGNGFKITGIQIQYTGGAAGFFSVLGGSAQITDVEFRTVDNGVAGSSSYYNAVVAGTVTGTCYIFRVIARGQVITGGDRAGGLFGYISGSSACIECGVFVVLVGGGSRVGADVGFIEGGWLVRSGVVSPSLSGAPAILFSASNGSVRLASPSDRQNYPSSWNFSRVWVMVGGYPELRGSNETSGGFRYDLELEGVQSHVSSIVRVDGVASQRRVLAITEETVVVSGDGGGRAMQVVVSQGVSSPDGLLELDLGGYVREVWLLGLDDWGRVFVPGNEYQPGAVVRPSSGFSGRVYVCIDGGQVGSEPEWWSEGTQAVGGAVFEARLYHRPLAHGPVTPEVT